MKEVEAKAKLRNPEAVRRTLAERGAILSEPVFQDDRIFVEIAGSLDAYLDNSVFLRLRVTEAPGALFTLKYNPHRKEQAKTGDFVALERETRLDDPQVMEDILGLLGYQEAVRVRKSRQTAKLEGYEVCIDTIVDTGTFIEVEKLTEDEDVSGVHEELWRFLESLGVSREDQLFDRYDTLMLRRNEG